MPSLLPPLTALTGVLLRVSLQASLLIALVLFLQRLLGKRLAPRVRYALWLLVVVRLLLPVSLESGVSVFNFTMAAPAEVFRAVAAASKAPATSAGVKIAPVPNAPAASVPARAVVPGVANPGQSAEAILPTPSAKASGVGDAGHGERPLAPVLGRPFPWGVTLACVWLAGVVFLLARIIVIPLRLNAQLARHETPTAPGVFEILEDSKRLSGVNQVLPIVQSRAVASPALLGFIRPWLLLPDGLVETFTPQELRLVFLHELAHLKRRDIAVNWLATLLQILHWPNPLVWLAFARMRADRELACDELALSFACAGESQSYGHAIIKLLEGFARPAALPGLVGILEDQTQMKKRITMIAQFKRMTGWSTAAVGLVFGIGIVTLTDAQTEKITESTRIFGTNAPSVRTLVSGTGSDAKGVVSPDESAIIYFGESGDIEVRELGSGRSRKLTSGAGGKSFNADQLIWSPDSKLLAYWWWQEDVGQSLRIISRDGGEPRVVSLKWDKTAEPVWGDNNPSFYPEDWSRDGRALVGKWRLRDHALILATVDVATGDVRGLGRGTTSALHARFSPDGRYVVYERGVAGNRDVYLAATDGNRTVRLTDSPAIDSSPIFSPNGRYVLFSSNQRGTWDLWAIVIANGETAGSRFLAKGDFGDHEKRITASGKLAFTVEGGGTNIVAFEVGASPSHPVALARTSFGRNLHPSWSPDGRRVAFARTTGGDRPWLLCVQSVEDGREELYETGMHIADWIFWAPDGQALALGGEQEEGRVGLFLFSTVTRERVNKYLGPVGTMLPLGFSRDGSEFNYLAPKGLLAVNIKTAAERILLPREKLPPETRQPGGGSPCGLSQDGRRVAFVTGNAAELVVISLDDQKTTTVARVIEPMTIRAPSFSPDGTQIAFYVRGGNFEKQQLRVAASDGSSNRLLHEGNFWHVKIAPHWSPDGTKIATTLAEREVAEIGVLENFLPKDGLAAK
jgi:beta-lactamase regulating signal transducer with metallopeptidase domain/Tol biopolymer transport system component